MFNELIKIIKENNKFLISTHVNPDGDGLGSELAFSNLLKGMGKEVHVINQDGPTVNYSFINIGGIFETYDREKHHNIFASADVHISIDLSSAHRLGTVEEELKNGNLVSVCFDHHPPSQKFADLHVVNEGAASIGEMIYDLANEMGLKLTKNIALGIYISILTDTGSFRYTNTNVKTHLITAELLGHGLEPNMIYKAIYENNSFRKLFLLGKMLNSLKLNDSGNLAWAIITQKDFQESGYYLDYGDKEGFIDTIRSLKGIEAAILFSEQKGNVIKISMRSKGNIDVNKIASKFGGGGHPFASGITLKDEVLEDIVKNLLKETSRSINAFLGSTN